MHNSAWLYPVKKPTAASSETFNSRPAVPCVTTTCRCLHALRMADGCSQNGPEACSHGALLCLTQAQHEHHLTGRYNYMTSCVLLSGALPVVPIQGCDQPHSPESKMQPPSHQGQTPPGKLQGCRVHHSPLQPAPSSVNQ